MRKPLLPRVAVSLLLLLISATTSLVSFAAMTPTPTPTLAPTHATAYSRSPTITGTSTPTPACGLEWRTVDSPNRPGADNYLNGVSAISANDVWAAGYSYAGNGQQTLIEHWDGVQWSMAATPDVAALNAVSALSASDVWAVGSGILHWNGTAWSIVPWPDPGQPSATFMSVSAHTSSDVWAVGSYWDGSATFPLVEHWDGAQWNIISTSGLKTQPLVVAEPYQGVDALAPNDVWAVGYTSGAGATATMVGHWDGTKWVDVPSPNAGYRDQLFGVASLAPNNIWAVGYTLPRGGSEQTLIEHWDGTQWSIVPSPNVGAGGSFLHSVTGITEDHVWAVGHYVDQADGTSRALVERWDGSQWSVVSSPGVSATSNVLNSISAVSAVDIWGVGSLTTNAGTSLTLAARYNNPCSVGTPTGTPTPTSQALVVGHVTWQGPPAQPNTRQQLPVTLTLCVAGTPVAYGATTDSSGFFTITTSLPTGTYNWRVKGPKYLATAGTTLLTAGATTQVEMGTQRAGDVNSTHDNIVNTTDFTTLKEVFGQANSVGDLNNDSVTNTLDFTLLQGNFGQSGVATNCP